MVGSNLRCKIAATFLILFEFTVYLTLSALLRDQDVDFEGPFGAFLGMSRVEERSDTTCKFEFQKKCHGELAKVRPT